VKCSDIKGRISKARKSFVCTGCTGQSASTAWTNVHIGDGAGLDSVDTFCYLCDILSIDGDADAAVDARVPKLWNEFRQLAPLLPIRTFPFL